MPQARAYKSGSVIYFINDPNSGAVYLLKAGALQKVQISVETHKEEKIRIMVGEFFGVKSALGKYNREETIQVLQDAQVLIFTPEEFEAITQKNVALIIKILKAFSSELRRIGRQISALLDTTDLEANAVRKLLTIGEYYFQQKRYTQALYAYEKFVQHNPTDENLAAVQDKIPQVREIISLGGKPPVETTAADENSPAPLLALTVDCATDEGKLVKSLLDALNSRDASVSEKCKNALAGKPSHEISEKLLLIQAYGHFSAEKFDEAITQAKDFLAKNKTSSFTDKMLLLIGDSYAAKKQTDACRAVYKKIIDKSPDSEEGKSAAQKMKELV